MNLSERLAQFAAGGPDADDDVDSNASDADWAATAQSTVADEIANLAADWDDPWALPGEDDTTQTDRAPSAEPTTIDPAEDPWNDELWESDLQSLAADAPALFDDEPATDHASGGPAPVDQLPSNQDPSATAVSDDDFWSNPSFDADVSFDALTDETVADDPWSPDVFDNDDAAITDETPLDEHPDFEHPSFDHPDLTHDEQTASMPGDDVWEQTPSWVTGDDEPVGAADVFDSPSSFADQAPEHSDEAPVETVDDAFSLSSFSEQAALGDTERSSEAIEAFTDDGAFTEAAPFGEPQAITEFDEPAEATGAFDNPSSFADQATQDIGEAPVETVDDAFPEPLPVEPIGGPAATEDAADGDGFGIEIPGLSFFGGASDDDAVEPIIEDTGPMPEPLPIWEGPELGPLGAATMTNASGSDDDPWAVSPIADAEDAVEPIEDITTNDADPWSFDEAFNAGAQPADGETAQDPFESPVDDLFEIADPTATDDGYDQAPLDHTPLDDTAFDDTPIDHTPLDHTAFDQTAFDQVPGTADAFDPAPADTGWEVDSSWDAATAAAIEEGDAPSAFEPSFQATFADENATPASAPSGLTNTLDAFFGDDTGEEAEESKKSKKDRTKKDRAKKDKAEAKAKKDKTESKKAKEKKPKPEKAEKSDKGDAKKLQVLPSWLKRSGKAKASDDGDGPPERSCPACGKSARIDIYDPWRGLLHMSCDACHKMWNEQEMPEVPELPSASS